MYTVYEKQMRAKELKKKLKAKHVRSAQRKIRM